MESYKFAHYQPQAIECISALTEDRKLLAISRSNSNIEVWSKDSWSQLVTIPGNQNHQARNIHWLEPAGHSEPHQNLLYTDQGKKRRLLTIGLNGYVMEWNLLEGTCKAKFNANAAIWDSHMINKKTMILACEDGSIKLVKVKKDGIVLLKTMQKMGHRCLSLAVMSDNVVFAGYADGSIRKWDV